MNAISFLRAARTPVLAAAFLTPSLPAQGAWATDTNAPGLGGRVWCFAEWFGELYAGGYGFMTREGPIRSVARWDGARWQPVGPGVQLTSSWTFGSTAVRAMCDYQGSLVVAGTFDMSGGLQRNNIARWDGTSFHALGQGLQEIGWDADVRGLAVYQSDLYAAGVFDTAGGISTPGIARWDGTAWHSVGGGVNYGPSTGNDASCMAVRVFGNDLIVGGDFTHAGGVPAANVARWDGSSFAPMGAGLHGLVQAFAEYNGELYASGAIAASGSTPLSGIARWNGSAWVQVGTVPASQFTALQVHGGYLYACGHVQTPGTGVMRWDGSTWTNVGVVGGVFSGSIGTAPISLGSHGQDLLLGGEFTRVGPTNQRATMVATTNVAAFDGAAWRQMGPGLGIDGVVAQVVTWRGGQVAVGNFQSAGSSAAAHLAFYDGDDWRSLGSFDGPLHGAAVYQGDLVVSGAFSWIDNLPIAGMARFDGSIWRSFGNGLSLPVAVHQGQLYAGSSADLRVWNGFGWTVVASVAGIVGDLHVHTDGLLYFSTTTWNSWRVYRWDGTTATVVGTPNDAVDCIASYGAELVVGGRFSSINGAPARLLAGWNGTQWSAFGAGVGGTVGYAVNSACELDGELYVGVNTDPRGFLLRWNGSTWSGLGTGIDGVPMCLLPDHATSSVRAFANCHTAGGWPAWNLGEWRNQPGWKNRLRGLAGAAGEPLLRGSGPLTAGSPFALQLQGPPSHVALAVLGFGRAHQPLLGGTLVPTPDATIVLLGDGGGSSSIGWTWPAGMPAGLAVFAQGLVLDATGPQGITFTNALQATAP